MLEGFVAAPSFVGGDDCGEGAGGDGEEGFEGEGEGAEVGVAFVGCDDAQGAGCEADDAAEGAAFDCGAGRGC